jgi:hypothetical protein
MTMELDKLGEALAKAQIAMTNPPRNREVEVTGETQSGTKYKYKFKYATLDAIIDHVRKPLTDNGIWFVQTIEGGDSGGSKLVTTLLHSSGQSIRSETPLLAEKKGNQGFGSALTYMRRYALTAMLGIAADEDDDANAADGNTITSSQERGGKTPDAKSEPKNPPGITKFREELRHFYADLYACTDYDTYKAFVGTKEVKAFLAKAQNEFANDWLGDGGDVKGIKENMQTFCDSLKSTQMAAE